MKVEGENTDAPAEAPANGPAEAPADAPAEQSTTAPAESPEVSLYLLKGISTDHKEV